ncbi:hypothetical protein TSAR_014009 [Trichomalopsis sarcophagae]|uniref:Uncharacterized protein n=1 Tax=Trichomalopsis sarcophagae TaxID=543379 RepID=A0A232EXN3_9HYME|nr:hypothetical protein TSAR_014009 [Trichomalopsis sarcophagae]
MPRSELCIEASLESISMKASINDKSCVNPLSDNLETRLKKGEKLVCVCKVRSASAGGGNQEIAYTPPYNTEKIHAAVRRSKKPKRRQRHRRSNESDEDGTSPSR